MLKAQAHRLGPSVSSSSCLFGPRPLNILARPLASTPFVYFLEYIIRIRRVIRMTNAIESSNARYRRQPQTRGCFLLDEQTARKHPYLKA